MFIKAKSQLLIFRIQCAIILAVTCIISLTNPDAAIAKAGLPSILITIIVTLLGLLTPHLEVATQHRSLLKSAIKRIIKAILIFAYPTSLIFGFSLLSLSLIDKLHLSATIPAYLILLGFLVSIPPYFKGLLINETGPITRMFFSFIYLYSFPTSVNQLRLIGFNVDNSFSMIIIVYSVTFAALFYVMHCWGFGLPKIKINSKVNYGWLLVAILPALAYLCTTAGSWSNLFHHFALKPVSGPITYLIVTVLSICCYEEIIFRYALFCQLLHVNQRSQKTQMIFGVVVSSLLFGLWHAQNMFYQSVPATLLQILSAIGIGFIYSTICLYTGTIWISIILHSLADLVGFPNGSSPFSQGPTPFLITFLLLISVIAIVVSLFLLLSHNQQAAFEQTMARIQIKQPQSHYHLNFDKILGSRDTNVRKKEIR